MRKLALLTGILAITSTGFGQDLAVTTLQSPTDGCELSSSEPIFVTVWNAGPGPHGGTYTVNYSLDNGPTVTASNSTTLLNNAVYNFTFPIPEDFSACQVHDLKIWVESGLDTNPNNDTLTATVTSDCAAIPGNIWGTSTICEGINDDTVFVSGNNGPVVAWENSPDGLTWNTTMTNDDFYHYTNLAGSTIWRVIVDSPFGICGVDTSSWYTLLADTQSDAGNLPADFDICDNGNGGQIHVTGINGQIQGWLLSTNFGGSWIPVGGGGQDTIDYNNLQNTTQYVVIVKNGVCPPDTSAMINLNLITGTVAGTIDGPSVVCNLENNDQLEATGGNGNVIGWNISTDSINWQPTQDTDNIFEFSGLGGQTFFQAIWEFGNCPQETEQFTVTTLPVIFFHTPDTIIDEGVSINLEVQGGNTYTWWPDQFMDDPGSATPIVDPDADITYFCEVVSIEGCKDTVRVVVTVKPDLTTLQIPNLITPNGDGYNDLWEIGNIQSFLDNEVTVFNSYGQVVYTAQPYLNEWGGELNGAGDKLPDGTYFYVLDIGIPEGNPEYVEPIKGVVTIAGAE